MSEARFGGAVRTGYFHGQALVARDLQTDADNERLLRGLHVRGQHDTWGVALGFDVSRLDPTTLQVGPGMAYDARGREVLSARTIKVGLPVLPQDGNDSWWFDLVIRASGPPERPLGDPGCTGGFDPREERPEWRWLLAGPALAGGNQPGLSPEARLGEDIPLVRCRVAADPAFDPALDFSVRRQAQGLVHPHIAGATVNRGMTLSQELGAFTTSVSTAAAGFSSTPFYFARVTIPALFDPELEETVRGLVGPFVSIRSPQRTSFQLDVRFGIRGLEFRAFAAATVTVQVPVTVSWVGIEPNGGCPPTLNLLTAIFLFQPLPFFFFDAAVIRGGFNG